MQLAVLSQCRSRNVHLETELNSHMETGDAIVITTLRILSS